MKLLPNGDGIKWPFHKRIAVMLTFDFDAEYLRYSVIGKENTAFSDISRGQYGPHEGLKRCLEMLERQNITTTFFVPAVVAQNYTSEVKEIAAKHELAYHGYEHEADLDLGAEREEVNMERSEALLERFSRAKIVGHRAPLDTLQECSLALMQKRGYLYSSNLKDCDWAYLHQPDASLPPVVELPTEPAFDDFSWFYFSYADAKTITCCYPSEYVYEFWKDAFDELASEGDKVMVLKLHPQLIGRVSRIRMLERLVLYMRQNGAWIAPCREVAQYVLSFNEMRAKLAADPTIPREDIASLVAEKLTQKKLADTRLRSSREIKGGADL